MKNKTAYRFPSSRLATHDVGRLSRKKHHVAGFLEVDVTEGRRLVRELIRAGHKVSLTAWLVKEISRTIEDHPSMNAFRTLGRRLVAFNDVNIAVPVEKNVDGERVPIVKLLMGTNGMDIEDICRELDEGRRRVVRSEKDYTPTSKWYTRFNRLFFGMPQFLRLLIWRLILLTPESVQKNIGTAIVTNAGAVGSSPGWIHPKSIHNTCVGLGSIVRKPRFVEGELAARDILHLTLLVDHDIVDGLPAAKFASALVRGIEEARELHEYVRNGA